MILHNTRKIINVTGENKEMTVCGKKSPKGKKQLSKIIDNKTGQTTRNQRDIMRIVRDSYTEIYTKTATREEG